MLYRVSQVFGPRGMLTCNNERPMCGMESHIGLRGRLAEPIYFSFSSRYQLAYVNEMEHFLDVIQGKDDHFTCSFLPFLIHDLTNNVVFQQ
jgi:predicted dehydrogenase